MPTSTNLAGGEPTCYGTRGPILLRAPPRASSCPRTSTRTCVHHRRQVEPLPVERLAQPIVEAGVGLRLRDRAVRCPALRQQFAPATPEPARPRVEPTSIPARNARARVAVDVDPAVEVALREAGGGVAQHAPCAAQERNERERGVGRALAELAAVGEHDAERHLRRAADFLETVGRSGRRGGRRVSGRSGSARFTVDSLGRRAAPIVPGRTAAVAPAVEDRPRLR